MCVCVCVCVCVCARARARNFLYHDTQINFWGHSEHKFQNSIRSIIFLGSSLRVFFLNSPFFKMATFWERGRGNRWTDTELLHTQIFFYRFRSYCARAYARECVCVCVNVFE